MTSKLGQPWIPIERIEDLIQIEPGLAILGLAAGAWLVYKILLSELSQERHKNLRNLFRNLLVHLVLATTLTGLFVVLSQLREAQPSFTRLASYVGLLALFSGTTVFVKTWRILVFEYLFLGHMRVRVPLLLVNLFTLLLSIVLGGWILGEVFQIRLAPVLATSAIFSLVVGLALQDTLGNLFAGVALQFDKPYEMGDWIEVQAGPQKWIGQVHEVSWRATVLIGLSEEALTIPNRVMGQAEISNFSVKARPIVRSQAFRIAYGTSVKTAKEILLQAASTVPLLRRNPAPLVIVSESAESWMTLKLVYFIDDYGSQFILADSVICAAVEGLEKAGIQLAVPQLRLIQPTTS